MASKQVEKIKVYIQKGSSIYKAAFQRCMFDQLSVNSKDEVNCITRCKLEDNKLLLQLSEETSFVKSSTIHNLKHPAFCPFLHLTEDAIKSLPLDITERGVDVGVATIVESSDGLVLMTRRAPHMRTFPGVWVPPGGHIELNETIEEAGFRELCEETGLRVNVNEKTRWMILGLWESVFPPILAQGDPKRHHLVIYLHIKLDRDVKTLQSDLKLNPDEVDACSWLDRELIEMVVHGSDTPIERNLAITLVSKNGEHIAGEVNSKLLQQKVPSSGVDVERMSTGTRYALNMWLKQCQAKTSSKSSL